MDDAGLHLPLAGSEAWESYGNSGNEVDGIICVSIQIELFSLMCFLVVWLIV